METSNAISALTALGHATRLAAFRLLVEAGIAARFSGASNPALLRAQRWWAAWRDITTPAAGREHASAIAAQLAS